MAVELKYYEIKIKNFKLNEIKLTDEQQHDLSNYDSFPGIEYMRQLWKENPEAFEVMDIDDLMEEYKENANEIAKLQERQEELKRYIEESLIKDGVEEYDSEIGKVKLTTKNAATSTNIDAELRLLNKDREKGDKIKKITMEVEKISKVCDIDANIELLKEHGIDLSGTKTSAIITLAKGDE